MKCPVHLYPTQDGPYPAWTVTWRQDGWRWRKKFSDQAEAKKFYKDLLDDFNQGRTVQVTEAERAAVARMRELCGELGLELETVVADRVDAHKLTRVSVTELARFWTQHHHNIIEKSTQEVITEFDAAKQAQGVCSEYQRNLIAGCTLFGKSFQMSISHITGSDIAKWFSGLKMKARSKNNFRRYLMTLFEFAKSRKYLPYDWREMLAVPRFQEPAETIEIFTVDEMRKLLAAANDRHIPFLAIAAFAGVRHAEIKRLVWSDIGDQYITVSAGKAKTASRRLVPIQPNLTQWLSPHRGKGLVCQYCNMVSECSDISIKAGVPWRQNALRHSYISYRLAITKHSGEVALEAGNSPQMVFKNYRELVTEEQAKAWFSLVPDSKKCHETSRKVNVIKKSQ